MGFFKTELWITHICSLFFFCFFFKHADLLLCNQIHLGFLLLNIISTVSVFSITQILNANQAYEPCSISVWIAFVNDLNGSLQNSFNKIQICLRWIWIWALVFNSLAPGRFKKSLRKIILKLILVTDGCDISSEIALRWTSLDLSDKATSHYLNQCWPRSLPPFGVTRPQ